MSGELGIPIWMRLKQPFHDSEVIEADKNDSLFMAKVMNDRFHYELE